MVPVCDDDTVSFLVHVTIHAMSASEVLTGYKNCAMSQNFSTYA